MNKEVTVELGWDIETLYLHRDNDIIDDDDDVYIETDEEIVKKYLELPTETTFTLTDTYGWEEERDYLESSYNCLVTCDEESFV